MNWSFERVAGPFTFTEGPAWDGSTLRFTDIFTSRILRYDPGSGACDTFAADTNESNGLTLDQDGRLVACEGGITTGAGRRMVRYEPDGRRSVLADRYQSQRLNEPNDVVVDSHGRVWFTDPCYGDRGKLELDHESVYRLDPRPDGGHAITRVTFDTVRPNGLVFSPDERTLYVAESPEAPQGARYLLAYAVLEDGSLGPRRKLYDLGPHRGIDGMRVDAEGNVVATCGWLKSGMGPRIAVFSPEGALLEEHPLPITPTNCCFGDEDLRTLYVTGYTDFEGYHSSQGWLVRARTSRRGLPR